LKDEIVAGAANYAITGGLTIQRARIHNSAKRFRAVPVTRPVLAAWRQHRSRVKLLYG